MKNYTEEEKEMINWFLEGYKNCPFGTDLREFQEVNGLTPISEKWLKEAEKRGFKVGVVFKGVQGIDKNIPIKIDTIDFNDLGLFCGNSYILYKGEWATIVKTTTKMSVAQLEAAHGYTNLEITK
jgi:hypothetical protein